MSRVFSWVTGSSTPISEWTLLTSFKNTNESLYQASARQFVEAELSNYDFNRPINETHSTDLFHNLLNMNGTYVLHHNFVVAHCPGLEEDNQWLLLDGQHRKRALEQLSREAQDRIICIIKVISYSENTNMLSVQETFRKINYIRGTTTEEREVQQKKFDDYQTLKDLLVKWTKDLSSRGGRMSCLTSLSSKGNSIKWKLSEPALREEINNPDSPLSNKTAKEIVKILEDKNTFRLQNIQFHLTACQASDDTKRDMFTKRFYIGYDFPKCLSEQ